MISAMALSLNPRATDGWPLKKHLSVATISIVGSAILGLAVGYLGQCLVYSFGTIYYLYFLSRMNLRPKGLLPTWTFIAALLAGFGYVSDTVRLLADPLGYTYFLPYLNRYVTPPVLFSGLVYLVTEYRVLFFEKIKNEAASDTVAHLAHDLRSPVLALNTIAQAVSKSQPDLAEIAQHAIGRIRDMCSNLVSSSRETHPSLGDVLAVVAPSVREKLTEFAGNGLQITLQTQDTDVLGYFDRAQLLRILSNILNNAVEASDQPPCRISVSVRAVNSGLVFKKRWAEIAVTDNGKGIEPNTLPLLGKQWLTVGKHAGSGLGLYTTRIAIEGWGGRLLLTSERDVGTTVTIRLRC